MSRNRWRNRWPFRKVLQNIGGFRGGGGGRRRGQLPPPPQPEKQKNEVYTTSQKDVNETHIMKLISI